MKHNREQMTLPTALSWACLAADFIALQAQDKGLREQYHEANAVADCLRRELSRCHPVADLAGAAVAENEQLGAAA